MFIFLVLKIVFCLIWSIPFIGPNYYVRVLSTLDRELLKPNSSVALHKHSNALVDVLPPEADSSIAMLTADEKPDVAYSGESTVYTVLVLGVKHSYMYL